MRAWIAREEQNLVAEEAAYRAAIAANADTIAGYVALTDFHLRQKKFDAAFAAMDLFAKRKPLDRWNGYHAGRLAAMSGQQLDRGEAALKAFIANPPPNSFPSTIARAHFWLGRIEEKRGATAAARAQFQTAWQLDPDFAAAKKALDALK